MQSIEIEKEVNQMKKVFVSYHFTTKDGEFNGFGNYVGEFDSESYEDIAKFILELQDAIANELLHKIEKECQVKVLFFR
ncbi:hypothetical protein LCGC14_1454770 [marine sediment metagenome]|uniref:Uncharacterized protein n=1 Tax=marine sediment metagenome TaxID=412755 RepID=A0A0F9MIP7_9ZZZZ